MSVDVTGSDQSATDDLIRELRLLKDRAGLSLTRLASRSWTSRSSLERYLNGKVFPPRDTVQALSEACGGDTPALLALWERAWEGLQAEGYPHRLSLHAHHLLVHGAAIASQAGDHEEAIRLAQDAVTACERHFGTDQPSAYTGHARLTLGHALRASGRTAEARTQVERAAILIAAAAGGDHPWVREARQALGQ